MALARPWPDPIGPGSRASKNGLDLARPGPWTVYTLVIDIKTADKEILRKIKSFVKVAVMEFGLNTLRMIKNGLKT